eukprot:1196099-Prorocentrum_minimum.AAC.7
MYVKGSQSHSQPPMPRSHRVTESQSATDATESQSHISHRCHSLVVTAAAGGYLLRDAAARCVITM